jgi:hypothetical protein
VPGSYSIASDSQPGVRATRDAAALMDAWGAGPQHFERQLSVLMEDLEQELSKGITEIFTLTGEKRKIAFARLALLITELATLAGAAITANGIGTGKSYGDSLEDVQRFVRQQQEFVRQQAILGGLRPPSFS